MLTLSLAAAAFGAWFAGPELLRRRQQQRLRRRCAGARALVLSYDDGPGATITPTLLDLLDHHDALATFFPLGFRAVRAPHLIERIVAAGHELGWHGYGHLNAWTAPWRAVADIDRGHDALAAHLGPGALFRPPHGRTTLATWASLRRRKAAIGWWTVDSGDTRARPPGPGAVVERLRAEGGGVLLLHDFERSPERHRFVLELTRAALEAARREGWTVRTLSALTGDGP